MKIFTSRYQNGRGILESGAVPIRITVGAPRFSLAYKLAGSIPELAPERAWFDRLDFEQVYLGKVAGFGVPYLRERFEGLGPSLVFLCFENVQAGEICHRRMFADWWTGQTGEIIAELTDLGPVKKPPKERKAEISEAVSRKADRLISDGRVRKFDDDTYRVAGDNGLYLVTMDKERIPISCTCFRFAETPWILCSHRVAAWRVDQGLVATLF